MTQSSKHKSTHINYIGDVYNQPAIDSAWISSYLPAVKRIIAIGDIHGDLSLARKCFQTAGLINNQDEWIADPPDTVVVQVGDQIDSWRPAKNPIRAAKVAAADNTNDMAVIDFFDRMHLLAAKCGGAVYSLLGNHEIMNVQSNFDYVSKRNMDDFEYGPHRGAKGRRAAFAPGGDLARHLAHTRPAILVIGSTMFAHAGVLPSVVRAMECYQLPPATLLNALNKAVKDWLLNQVTSVPPALSKLMIKDTTNSPFWNRVLGNIPVGTSMNDKLCSENLQLVLDVFKIGHMVIGHTPQINVGINGTCDEVTCDANRKVMHRLYRIDNALSKAFDAILDKARDVQILEICDDKNFRIITASSQ